jgi:hypothetical protein
MPELMWGPADAVPAAGPEPAPASPVSSDRANSGAMWREALAMCAKDLRSGTGTEEMRTAVQHYRAFWSHLKDLPTKSDLPFWKARSNNSARRADQGQRSYPCISVSALS